MTEIVKTQWHPAFCSAMKLELIEDAEYLDYESEHNLNTKPLQIDLLIVKKIKNFEVKNELGKIFRKHNILEYKSPKDSMNLNTFLKVIAYACLYKTYEESVDDIKLDEITITLVRERKPQKLFRWLKKNQYQIEEKYPGIYYVCKENCFPTQVIVSSQLSKENQKWLTLLSSHLNQKDVKRTVKQLKGLTKKTEKIYADSVLQVSMTENKLLFNKMSKEDAEMCEALREFFAADLKEAEERGMERGMERGVKVLVLNALNKGHSILEISDFMGISLEEIERIKTEAL